MSRATTICCSAFALILIWSGAGTRAIADKPPAGPIALAPTRPLWTLALNNALTAPPAYDGERAFFSLSEDRLVAYEILSGKQLWIVAAASPFAPAAGNDLIFIAEADALTARRAGDGSIAWKVPLAKPFVMRPVWDNGWLIGVTDAGAVLAFRAIDGHLVWQRDVAEPHAPPSLGGDRVYLPAANGRVIAMSVTDGSVVWSQRVGGLPTNILALDERLYVGSTDNFFYCLMARDGRIDWRWRTGADVIGVPVSDKRRVYFTSLDNVLRAMNLVSGAQEWMRALPVRPTSGPLIAGATIAVSGQSPTVRTFSAKDGTPGTDINVSDEVTAPPYVLTQPGTALPMLLVTTRNIAKGAAATLVVRAIEPTLIPALNPLPGLVKPVPTPATR